ncbi:MAG TPA: SIMPL domain-containing protein [Bacillota bacterium]|nr:SIMPL domain-containing protein [Bacillota bacterium]
MYQPQKPQNHNTLVLDYRLVCLALLAVIVAMAFVWKPWQTNNTKDRTIQVTGEATVTAEPDEYAFTPAYTFTDADKQTDLTNLTAKSNEVVAKLKGLGVANSKIKTNTDNWSYPVYDSSNAPTYRLQLTVTVGSKELAQKVQDYLLTTNPSEAITPQATFSDAKRNALEDQARDKATKDARAKADQSAKNLGFKVSNVKAVEDGAGFGGIMYPMGAKTMTLDAASGQAAAPSLSVQPGENDLNYSVTVTYYIR